MFQRILADNILPVITGPKTKNRLLLQYWLNYKVPAVLRKHKVDVFVSIGNCSLRTKVPQCLVINELAFLHYPQFFTRSWFRFHKKNTPGFLNKATIITTAAHPGTTCNSTNEINASVTNNLSANGSMNFPKLVI